MPDYPTSTTPLRATCEQWMAKIKSARDAKWEAFGKYAEEASKFYDALHDFMWSEAYSQHAQTGGFLGEGEGAVVLPTFRMSVNRLFEAVALFGPVLYHRNPNVQVTPRLPPEIPPEALGLDLNDPYGQMAWQQLAIREQMRTAGRNAQAQVLQAYANWLQYETDKKTEAQLVIDEAIIKGMGVSWTEMHQPAGSEMRYPKSFYDSVDNLVVDPDAERWEDVQWVARRCIHPIWQVEEEYGLRPGSIKGHYRSLNSQADVYGNTDEKATRKSKETSFDLLEYWKVYSKAGFGSLLRKSNNAEPFTALPIDQFGKHCFLAVALGLPWPLNLPPEATQSGDLEQMFQRAQWPIPYYTDGGWPFAPLKFYNKPNCVWPISLVKPVIGELRFVNWCMSFLADKVAAGSATLVGVLKSAAEDIREQLQDQQGTYKIIELSEVVGAKRIEELISFLQAPTFDIQIWTMVSEVLEMIDKRTGLTELVYGLTGVQMRSASEAEIKSGNVSVRPDHMVSQTEDWISLTCVKELQAARWMLTGADVLPVVGELGAYIWDSQILTSAVDAVVRDFDHRIEAGSARKPNKQTRIRQLNEFGAVILPTLQALALNGAVDPWNAYISDMAKSLDLDPAPYLIQLPEPLPPEQQPPDPEQVKLQMEQMRVEMEMRLKQAELEIKRQELQMKQEQWTAEFQHEKAMNAERLKFERQSHRQKLDSAEEQADAKLQAQKQAAKAKAQAKPTTGAK